MLTYFLSLLRDSKIFMLYEGTSEIQRRIVSKYIEEQYKP